MSVDPMTLSAPAWCRADAPGGVRTPIC